MDKPLLTVDRQMGLVIITPEGKVGIRPKLSLTSFQEAKTMFKRLSYDAERDQSILHCEPDELSPFTQLMSLRSTIDGQE